jgi:hypothetical protein
MAQAPKPTGVICISEFPKVFSFMVLSIGSGDMLGLKRHPHP